ncbi:hypothetical protein ABH935_009193 [Catenulispora sp. GAS73]|uniref:hypothetical protein n=1 Tax=Catenulispora sp. GAS73 TaxID=3156269 RepID=UPI003516DFED
MWAAAAVQRFEAMACDTSALRAHHRNMLARMADGVARRAGLTPGDPEPQIAAVALVGLWSVQVD